LESKTNHDMSEAIIVDKLSKKYVLGTLQRDTMLRERLISLLRAPFRKRSDAANTLWALRDVSFRVSKGEVVGIIGRNGAGKSTLLKVLSKITYPTSGRVRVQGRIASLLEVGTGFHEELTGRENIYLNGSILGMKGWEVAAKLDSIVNFAGVERFIDTPIKRYSTGMRLRLGFAVAAHLDPDLLIVDEVLAVGDAGFQKKCLNTMEGLRTGGRTVLFVSHNMAAVENLCSRCIWIDAGEVHMDGSPREVIDAYMSSFANAQETMADLSSAQNRRGTGDIRYTAIEYLSRTGERLNVIRSGDSFVIRFRYHASKPVAFPSFGFRLYTELGSLITDTSTWHHAIEIPLVPAGDGHVDLHIDLLNLMPGRYYFSLWITGAGSPIQDNIEHCAQLEVELANVYSSGRLLDNRSGIVFFPQHWELGGLSHTSSEAAGSDASAESSVPGENSLTR
jgi:lipopolysaccharide transport system ATP-binding protein